MMYELRSKKCGKVAKSILLFMWVSLFASQVHALPLEINPLSGDLNISRWEGPETSQDVIGDIVALKTGATMLYKSNQGGVEEKSLAASYETTFSDPYEAGDWTNAVITWQGPDFVGPIAYLLVKDGNADTAWYLFNLTALGWADNGQETIILDGFWKGVRGSISNVSLWGDTKKVPEPATMLLLGCSLIGLAAVGRKKFR